MSERVSFLSLLALFCIAVLWLFQPFLIPILVSITFAISLWPVYTFFKKILFGLRWPAALVTTLLLALILAFPLAFLATLVTEQTVQIVHRVPEMMQEWLPIIRDWNSRLRIPIHWEKILPDFVQRGAAIVSQFSPKIVMQTTQFILNFLVTLLLTFFLFIEGPTLYQNLLILSPLKESYEQDLSREIRNTLNACLYGYVLTALTQGILAGIGFAIAKIPIAALLGVATVFMSFIPIIGAAGVWVPVVVYLGVTHQWGMAIFMLIYGVLIISGIDNLIKPLIIQGKTRIHPVLIFLALFGGLKLLGPIGILVGPIIIAIFIACVKIYKRDFLSS